MTFRARSSRAWIALSLVLLAIVFYFVAPGARPSPEAMGQLLGDPTSGAVGLITLATALLVLRLHLASELCAATAVVWLGFDLLPTIRQAWRPDNELLFEAHSFPTICCFLLSLALLQRNAERVVTFCLATIGANIAFLMSAAGLGAGMTISFTLVSQSVVCLVVGIARIYLLARDGQRLDAENELQRSAPIIVAAATVGLVVWQLSMSVDSVSQRAFWMIVTGTISLWLTTSLFAMIMAESGVLRLTATKRQLKGLLRQRRRMLMTQVTDLRTALRRYDELFQNVPAAVVLTKADGEILSANPAMLELLGVASEEVAKSRNFASFYADPELRSTLVEKWKNAKSDIHRGEFELMRDDGERRNVIDVLRTLRKPDRSIDLIQGTLTDITDVRRAEAERLQLESTLRLSQKLESVGRLAAGIAHEINTPMQYIGDNVYFIRGAFELLRERDVEQKKILDATDGLGAELVEALLALDHRMEIEATLPLVPGALDRAREGIEAVTHIVAAMKELAHPGQGSKVSTNVNDLIHTALTVTRNAYKTVAKAETELGDIPNVLIYKNEMCQVLINLIVNAAHAIENAEERSPQDGLIRIKTWSDDDYVYIEAEDNGCGIPDAIKEKIFDPFFTTKAVGRGTGQGLAIARTAIVDMHGGEIGLDDAQGGGTQFTIKLPTKVSEPPAGSNEKETRQ